MNLINFCGGIALAVACFVVLFALFLALMLGFCVVLGAADGVSNPHASQDAQVSYQDLTAEIGTGTTGLNQAVRNITGG